MLINQKLRIHKESTDNFKIVVTDDTGFKNEYNRKGYGVSPILTSVDKYVFIIEDLIRGTNEKVVYSNTDLDVIQNPSTEAIQYGVQVTLNSGDIKFKDSLYKVYMTTSFDISVKGDGLKGLDYITNVPSADSIAKNYSSVTAGNDTYVITGSVGDKLLLDRVIDDNFFEFNLGFHAYDTVSLFTDIQSTLIKKTESLCNCKCGSKKDSVYKLAELSLYLKAVKENNERGDNDTAVQLLNTAMNISKYLKSKTC